jgi:hypothetical protein
MAEGSGDFREHLFCDLFDFSADFPGSAALSGR